MNANKDVFSDFSASNIFTFDKTGSWQCFEGEEMMTTPLQGKHEKSHLFKNDLFFYKRGKSVSFGCAPYVAFLKLQVFVVFQQLNNWEHSLFKNLLQAWFIFLRW